MGTDGDLGTKSSRQVPQALLEVREIFRRF